MREQVILQSVAPFFEEIEKLGYDVHATSDFEEIQRLVAQTGRAQQTPMMSIERLDFTRKDAFWAFLMKDGEAIGGAGVKYTDLESEPFTEYLQRTSRAQYGRESDPIASFAPPLSDMLKGKLVYIGELEFRTGTRGNLKLLAAFGKVLQGLATLKWPQFDWMYAIIPEEHLKFDHLYGFFVTVPDALTWAEPVPAGRLNSHAFLAIEGRHIEHLFKVAGRRTRLRNYQARGQKPE
ncbi:hypothetical protein N4R57_03455 [Rhodobacteraceae bacterium D3-12]|nr:hypothetical protein N4R57_03455 [Rhodobacteraceae bacterium D3-12]